MNPPLGFTLGLGIHGHSLVLKGTSSRQQYSLRDGKELQFLHVYQTSDPMSYLHPSVPLSSHFERAGAYLWPLRLEEPCCWEKSML